MKIRIMKILLVLMLCLSCVALGSGLTLLWMQRLPVEIPQLEAGSVELEQEDDALPEESPFSILDGTPEADILPEGADTTGALYISEARSAYKSRSLRLIIPKLELDESILDGVTARKLAAGDGLYPYAQLPSEENGNVSIAGHRNGLRNGRPVPSRKFYYLNTLTEGDYLYLTYDGVVYQYLWECTEVILPDNWEPIRNRGYGCITLTTCTPIGVSDHRLVVRGALVDSFPYSQDAVLPSGRAPY